MATYDLEEQEQLAEIKAWWRQYGNLLTNVLLGAVIAVAAWQAWNWYQRDQAGRAAMIYSGLQSAVQAQDSQKIKAASGELLENFGGSKYASLGALTAAKALVDGGDGKTATIQLQWVAEHGENELRDLARLRLAALLIDENDERAYDQALAQLDGDVGPGFEARFADVRGDVLAAAGKKTEALSAYRDALARVDAILQGQTPARQRPAQSTAIYRGIVQQKIDALGGGK